MNTLAPSAFDRVRELVFARDLTQVPAEDVGRSVSVFTTGSALGRSGALLLGGALLAWIASPLVRGVWAGLEAWRVLFFLSVVVLMPFALGPDLALLKRIGPSILWLGATAGVVAVDQG